MAIDQAVPEQAVERVARAAWRTLVGALLLAVGPGLALALLFDRLGFPGLAAGAAALALALLAAGWRRFDRSGGAEGRLLLAAAVVLAPLAVHGLARALELGRPFDGGPATLGEWVAGPWFPVQAAAALAAGLALHRFGIPFLASPLAAAAWCAAQDTAPLLFGRAPSWPQRAMVSALSGLVFLAAGMAVDRRTRGDVAFWLYLPGLLALGGGLATWTGASDGLLLLFILLDAGLVVAALLLDRRSFAVVGALGLAASVGRLADDLLDPAVLTAAMAAVALGLVGLGLLFHLHQRRLELLLLARLPGPLARLLPPHRR
jgi:hypothetical protein